MERTSTNGPSTPALLERALPQTAGVELAPSPPRTVTLMHEPPDGLEMVFGWKNSMVRAVLLGTIDSSSPLWVLAGQQNILYHIFSFWAEVLVCLGGRTTDGSVGSSGRLATAEMFSWASNRWVAVPSMCSARSAGIAIVHRNDLYVFGGYDGTRCLDTAEVFRHKTQEWVPLPPMALGRCAAGVAVQGSILIVGGYSSPNPMVCEDVVEEFCTRTSKWISVAPLLCRRARLAVAAVGRQVYAFGGSPEQHDFVNTVEMYDSKDCTWTEIAPMKHKKAYATATAIGRTIFVCGGFAHEGVYLNQVEAFDVDTQVWTEMAPMLTVRSASAAVEVQGLLYVLGGYHPTVYPQVQDDRLSAVERYDPKTNTWEQVTRMRTPRSHLMAVKYSCLSGFRTLLDRIDPNPY